MVCALTMDAMGAVREVACVMVLMGPAFLIRAAECPVLRVKAAWTVRGA